MKAGYKTTEFWLTLAATVLGALVASGVFGEEGVVAKVVGVVMAALVAAGYTQARTKAKAKPPEG